MSHAKILLLFVLYGVCTYVVHAQIRVMNRYHIMGRVMAVDAYNKTPYVLKGANVRVTCLGDTTLNKSVTTDNNGTFDGYLMTQKTLKDNRMEVTISYVGMEPWQKIYSPTKNADAMGLDFEARADSIVLQGKPITLQEATIIGKLQQMYQSGDTTVFNVDAYKMPTGSVLLELVRRLPGLQYIDGQLTYNGRTIEEMRLNGDTFFKHDISIALKNMPNAELKTVQIYEAKKDTNSIFSDKKLVMDMKTKSPLGKLQFGNAEAGIANHDADYLLGADGSFFKKGGAQIHLEYKDANLPNTALVEKVYRAQSAAGSYMVHTPKAAVDIFYDFNGVKHRSEESTVKQQQMADAIEELTHSVGFNGSNGKYHIVSAALLFNISPTVRLNTNINFNNDWLHSFSHSTDTVSSAYALLSRSMAQFSKHTRANNLRHTVQLSKQLGDNWTVGVDYTGNFQENRSDQEEARSIEFVTASGSDINYHRMLHSPEHDAQITAGPFVKYTVSKEQSVQWAYHFSTLQSRKQNRYTNLADNSQPIDSLSNTLRNHQYAHELSAEWQYAGKQGSVDVKATLSRVNRNLDYWLDNGYETTTHQHYTFFSGSVKATKRLYGASQMQFTYDLNHQMPVPLYTMNYISYADPMNIIGGNTKLKMLTAHAFMLSYIAGPRLNITANYSVYTNAMTFRTRYDTRTGIRSTTPDNINGAYSLGADINSNWVLGKVTLNGRGSYKLNHDVSFYQIQDTETRNSSFNHNVLAVLNGNYGGKFGFVQGSFSYTYLTTDVAAFSNRRINYTTALNTTFYLPAGFQLASELSWLSRHGSYVYGNHDEVVWNAELSKSLFAHKAGTLSLKFYDLLHNRHNYDMISDGDTFGETRQTGITSFVLLKFSYRLSRFGF